MYIMQIAYAKEKPQATYKHSCFECSSFSFRSFSRDLFISITGDMEINHKMEIIANFQLNVKECWRLDRHVGKCGQIFFGFSSQLRNSCGTLKKFQQKCVVSSILINSITYHTFDMNIRALCSYLGVYIWRVHWDFPSKTATTHNESKRKLLCIHETCKFACVVSY